MKVVVALVAVLVLALVPYYGTQVAGTQTLFGIVLPYAAVLLFIGGMVYRVLGWARSPVPFRIPTTCGQQKSLPWIKWSRFDNPTDTFGVVVRMALEIFLFRSLFRNTSAKLHEGPRVSYGSTKWLWAAGLAFHYAFLVVLLRHLRFFAEPVPGAVTLLATLDGFMQVSVPTVYITTALLGVAVAYLLLRRLAIAQVRYISLLADYFPLLLILGIGTTGVLLRHFVRSDITGIKELTLSLVRLQPALPAGLHPLFFTHLFLVCALFAYFPFSKLVHLGGVFLSPTRNLANNNRVVHHVNPWGKPGKPFSYEDYENEFRDRMKAAGIPVEKE